MSIVTLHKNKGIPKYQQIVNSIEKSIVKGIIKKGEKLPSINTIKNQYGISRDTVLTAFNDLKNRGIIHSVVGKGYYVSTENVEVKKKIFLLFDELNSFKEDLYAAFVNTIGKNIQIDIYFHHFNETLFKELIYLNSGNYTHYVVMPANLKKINEVLEILPKEKVYILDQTNAELVDYAAIYQNFEKDMHNRLFEAISLLTKYSKIVLLFSDEKQPKGLLKGFEQFCNSTKFNYEIIKDLEGNAIEKGAAYIVLDDRNLIRLIKKIRETNLCISEDVGIISYNDSMLKEVVEGGITTFSTDFKLMGERLADMILTNEHSQVENPSYFIKRNSL